MWPDTATALPAEPVGRGSPHLRVSAAARHPEAWGWPRRTRILCSAPELPRARGREEQSCLFSRKKKKPSPSFRCSLEGFKGTGHPLTPDPPACSALAGSSGVRHAAGTGSAAPQCLGTTAAPQPALLQGTVPAGPSEAQRAHTDTDRAVPQCQTLNPPQPLALLPSKGSCLAPYLSAHCHCHRILCRVCSVTAGRGRAQRCSAQLACQAGCARLPGWDAPIHTGWGAGGIPRGAAGTVCRVRTHTRAALLRLWRCAGVRGTGVLPGRSCSPG